MGNSLVVEKPYIIDDYPSDDDDDDDDNCSYESAYEGSDVIIDKGGYAKVMVKENVDALSANVKGDVADRQVSVDSKVVSHLVKEVEQLLTFLGNNDFESAQRAAKILKDGGQADEEEEQNLLPEAQQQSTTCTTTHMPAENHSSVERKITLGKKEDCQQYLLSEEAHEEEDESAISSEGDWTEEERKALAKLDADLDQFEEDESMVISSEIKAQQSRRTEKSSAIPTFRYASNKGAMTAESVDEPDYAGGSSVNAEEHKKAFVPFVLKETHSSKVSSIPRFSTSGSSLVEGDKVSSPVPGGVYAKEDHLLALVLDVGDKEKHSEEMTQYFPEVNGKEGSSGTNSTNDLNPDQEGEDHSPVMREIKFVLDGQNSKDDRIKVTDTSAWEINISDMSGRAKKNKKRSGIPSLWSDSTNKTATTTVFKASTESGSNLKSPSSSSSLPRDAQQPPLSRTTEMQSTKLRAASVTDSESQNLGSSPRKIFDLKRWYCISRPQYKTSCGISSVVSCWNVLFSTLGHGSLAPLTQEEAIRVLGYNEPYEKLRFGPFTGNLTILRWFRELCNHFKVKGRCHMMFKPNGRNRTIGVTDTMALEKVKLGLQDPCTAFIYHCHNHYFCPIGYEESPKDTKQAYSGKLPSDSVDYTWILIGDTSRKYGPFHCISWKDICQDLHLNSPEFINVRKSWQGVQTRQKNGKSTGNLHCIMCFQRPKDLQSFIPTTHTRTSIPRSSSSRLPRRSPSPSSRRNGEEEFRFVRDEGIEAEMEDEDEMEEGIEVLTSDVSSCDEDA